jgi:hypothetical protein
LAERQMVQSLLFMSHEGTAGHAFHGVSIAMNEAMRRGEMSIDNFKPTAKGSHKYTVIERFEKGGGVPIRLEYSVKPREIQAGN